MKTDNCEERVPGSTEAPKLSRNEAKKVPHNIKPQTLSLNKPKAL